MANEECFLSQTLNKKFFIQGKVLIFVPLRYFFVIKK
jgi:hypothetical protein